MRKSPSYPVSDLLRSYQFFNRVLFGGVLPDEVAITVIRGPGRGDPLG